MKHNENSTISFYNDNAENYIASTLNADMTEHYGKFLPLVPVGGLILDAGCGSGRDSKFFLDRCYRVEAFDASVVMVDFAKNLTGLDVKCAGFETVQYDTGAFDGIWACASLLHVDRDSLVRILKKYQTLLRIGGVMYLSFKNGEGVENRNIDLTNNNVSSYVDGVLSHVDGREFYFYNINSLRELIEVNDGFEIVDIYLSGDVRPGRESEQWVSAVVRKI
jgi:SAM-dependent methyltransferase